MRKNTCIVNNLHCLLLYLLIKDENSLDNTFFFFDDDIPEAIMENFKNYTKFFTPESRIGQFFFVLKLRMLTITKYKQIKQTDIFGQDNLLITSPLIGTNKINVLEDGLANYTCLPKERRFKYLKRLIGGPLMAEKTLGYSSCVSKVYLTGMAPIPEALKSKTILINIEDMWNRSSQKKKNEIINCFNLTKDIIEEFRKCDSVLITQPLSEDKVITEEEKIELYRRIINDKKVAIKPHPRERTNYKKHFPYVQVLESHVPIELLSLLGVSFTDVYTIFSTAAMQFSGNPKVHFLGTDIHPALERKFGKVKYVDGKIASDIV